MIGIDDEVECTHARQLRVLIIAGEHIGDLMRGLLRVANMPADGKPVKWTEHGSGLAVRVHSPRFSPVPLNQPIPTMPAVVSKTTESADES